MINTLPNVNGILRVAPDHPVSREQHLLIERMEEQRHLFLNDAADALQQLLPLWNMTPRVTPVLESLLDRSGKQEAIGLFQTFFAGQWHSYWAARAEGSGVSRLTLTAQLHLAHFTCSVQAMACGGELDEAKLASLAARHWDEPQGLRVEAVKVLKNGISVASGAFSVHLLTAAQNAQLLYSPGPQGRLQAFESRNGLLAFLGEDHALSDLQENPFEYASRCVIAQLYASILTVVQTEVAEELQLGLSEGLRCAERLDDVRFVAPERPSAVSTKSSPSPLLLGHMDDDPRWRSWTPGTALAQLQTAQTHMLAVRAQNHTDAEQLLGAAQKLLAHPQSFAQNISQEPSFDRLVASRAQGILAEARMERALTRLSEGALTLIEGVVAGPTAALRTDNRIQVLSFEWMRAGQIEFFPGVLAVVRAEALDTPLSASAAVLFWPGRSGGLHEFASWQALLAALVPEQEAAQVSVTCKTLDTHVFEHSVLEQLVTYEQRATAIETGSSRFDDAPQLQASLQRLHAETLGDLEAPVHAARDNVLGAQFERERVIRALHVQPGWLAGLTPQDGDEGKRLVRQMCDAMHDCHELLAMDLPPRGEFVEDLVMRRLIDDFALSAPVRVTVQVPESVEWVKDLVAGSGSPGTPFRKILQPSEQKVSLSLADVALMGIDEAFKERLNFLQVGVEIADEEEAERLKKCITAAYLVTLVKELDVAEKFEQRIRAVHTGIEGESAFAMQRRREQISAPYLAQMRLHTWVARVRKVIGPDAELIINQALLPKAVPPSGDELDIVLRSIILNSPNPGINATGVALAGVVLIEDRTSGKTVMYLPQAPNRKILSEYDSPQQACQSLVRMALEPGMADYLSILPASGDPVAHASYIRQAQLKKFDGFISLDKGLWPRTVPLPQHQANMQMGRMFEAHRSTSRSQTDLYFELASHSTSASTVFGYISMALGVVPFVGTGLALFDALRSVGYSAVAFVEGRVREGLDHVEAVFLSLIDAAMDSLPAGSATGMGRPRFAPRLRRFSSGFRAAIASSARSSRVPFTRFDGYESSTPLWKLSASSLASQSDVYTIGSEKYVVRDAKVYSVQWDATYSTWRLRGNDVKTYKQPITLDYQGRWDTQGAVDGALVRGGLPGGGAYLSRMLRDGLTGAAGYLRRRIMATETAAQRVDRLCAELSLHYAGYSLVARRYEDVAILIRRGDSTAQTQALYLKAATDYRDFHVAAIDLVIGIGPQGPRGRSGFSTTLNHHVKQGMYASRSLESVHSAYFNELRLRIKEKVDLDPGNEQAVVEAVGQLHEEAVGAFGRAMEHRAFQESWYERVKGLSLKESLRKELKDLFDASPTVLEYKIARTLWIVYAAVVRVPVGPFFRNGFRAFKGRVDHVVCTYADLISSPLELSKKQRTRMFASVVSQFRRIELELTFFETCHGHYLQKGHWSIYRDSLLDFKRDAEAQLTRLEDQLELTAQRKTGKKSGPSQQRVFETVDDELMIGVQRKGKKGDEIMEVIQPGTGIVNETYRRRGGRWALVEPGRPHALASEIDVDAVLAEAEEALTTLDNLLPKAGEYAKTSMEPASVEDVLGLRARELDTLSDTLATVSPQPPVVQMRERLSTQSQRLRAEGVRLRIEACRRLPTQGNLDYLLGQGAASIRKVRERMAQKTRKGRIGDYLQEYEILGSDGQPLWYAHFHYARIDTAFADFSRAHLKIPEQRHLGLQFQTAQQSRGEPVTKILREPIFQTIAIRHFQAVD